jgi:hypothetical protein
MQHEPKEKKAVSYHAERACATTDHLLPQTSSSRTAETAAQQQIINACMHHTLFRSEGCSDAAAGAYAEYAEQQGRSTVGDLLLATAWLIPLSLHHIKISGHIKTSELTWDAEVNDLHHVASSTAGVLVRACRKCPRRTGCNQVTNGVDAGMMLSAGRSLIGGLNRGYAASDTC